MNVFNPEDADFWRNKDLRKRIEACYVKIQKAWSKQRPELASSYMSHSLLEEQIKLINEMKKEHIRNVVLRVEITQIRAIFVSPDRDYLQVKIASRMIDYRINVDNHKLLSGRRLQKGFLEERWEFIKQDRNWVADRIFS